jgi:hypothetical protein
LKARLLLGSTLAEILLALTQSTWAWNNGAADPSYGTRDRETDLMARPFVHSPNRSYDHALSGQCLLFSDEYQYWETHYGKGGSSGEGSVGRSREWKWRIINSHVKEVDDVIDIGCGDLSFWEDRVSKLSHYFGLDISPTIIERNQNRYPDRTFRVADAKMPILGLKGRIVLCLDLLFHIMDDDAFFSILENLCRYSLEWIFVFTWCGNPFNLAWRLRSLYAKLASAARMSRIRPLRIAFLKLPWVLIRSGQLGQDIRFLVGPTHCDGRYQKYRRFEKYLEIFEKNDFELIAKHRSPCCGGVGAMYVFHTRATA